MDARDDVHRGWPTPLGTAAPAPYADDREHAAGLFATAAGALAGWLAVAGAAGGPWPVEAWQRCADQAAALSPPGLVPGAPAICQALHRARLAATRRRPLLAAAFDAWALSDDEQLLIGLALGFELSPAHARLIAEVGGLWHPADPVAPTLVSCGAALQPGAARPEVAAVAERLARGAALTRLALVGLEGPDPLWRRRLRVTPRLIALAAGHLDLDDVLLGAAELRRGDAARAARAPVVAEARRRLHEHLRAPGSAAVPVLALQRRSALGHLIDVVAELDRPVLLIAPGACAGVSIGALVREVQLHRAVPVVACDHGEPGARLLAALRQARIAHLLSGSSAPPPAWLGEARLERLILTPDEPEGPER